MSTVFLSGARHALRFGLLPLAVTVLLAACGGGGDDSSPATTPPPPPPPASNLPPQAATAINLDDNHQVGVDHWPDGNTSSGGQGSTTGGLDCLVNMDETYHVHTHVSIFLNGEALSVPADIGIVSQAGGTRCFYSIHTHDKSGKIHVEAPAPGTFTLGQLFAIWGENLLTTDVGGLTGMAIKVYVTDDGVVTEATGDWHDIELKSHREITIQVGTAITEIPNFTWSAN